MASIGTVSMCLFMREANFWTKCRTSTGVFDSVAQRRHSHREDLQAVIEVTAELLFLHHLPQVTIRRGDHTDIDPHRPGAAQPFEFLFLEHAQQLDLQLERNLPTSSRKIVPRSANSNRPIFVAIAPVKAPFMAKELAFQQTGGNRGAIEFDEGPFPSAAEIVERARDQFLSTSCLAENQHRGISGRHRLHLVQHLVQRTALPTISSKL